MKATTEHLYAKLYDVAEGQGGFFTYKQAVDAGFVSNHHSYHVKAGNWIREAWGIFRLAQFPMPERADLIRYSLWSRNRQGQPQGVYSHQTALSLHDLSDVMPSKLNLTVPKTFRKNSAIPSALVLHYANLLPEDIEKREGYRVTRPLRTLLDLVDSQKLSSDLMEQAIKEAQKRGLITVSEFKKHHTKFQGYLKKSV